MDFLHFFNLRINDEDFITNLNKNVSYIYYAMYKISMNILTYFHSMTGSKK